MVTASPAATTWCPVGRRRRPYARTPSASTIASTAPAVNRRASFHRADEIARPTSPSVGCSAWIDTRRSSKSVVMFSRTPTVASTPGAGRRLRKVRLMSPRDVGLWIVEVSVGAGVSRTWAV